MTELTGTLGVSSLQRRAGAHARDTSLDPVLALHSRPAPQAEIPRRFSSSLLPPSFAAGRCAAVFIPGPGLCAPAASTFLVDGA